MQRMRLRKSGAYRAGPAAEKPNGRLRKCSAVGRPSAKGREPPSDGADRITPEIARQIIHKHMDQHYRATLDQPVPALGSKTPRQTATSAASRKKVIEWLKLIESCSANHPDASQFDYDFHWMRGELGIGERRR